MTIEEFRAWRSDGVIPVLRVDRDNRGGRRGHREEFRSRDSASIEDNRHQNVRNSDVTGPESHRSSSVAGSTAGSTVDSDHSGKRKFVSQVDEDPRAAKKRAKAVRLARCDCLMQLLSVCL